MGRANIVFGGKSRSINELSRLFGVNRQTLRDRLNRGMTIQQALHYPKGARSDSRIITSQDGVSMTIPEWAKTIGIGPRALLHRIEQGWPRDKWLLPNSKGKPITAFGKTQTITEWANEMGIDRRTLHSRLTRSSLTPELALTLPIDELCKRKDKRKESA